MRKLTSAALALLILMLCGCADSIDIKNRIIVQAMGFDFKDGQYQITLQYFFRRSSEGKSDLGTSESNARTVNGSGATVAEAVRQISSGQGKQVFFGKNNILIFGSTVGGDQFESIMDYLIHDCKGRGNNYVFAAENDAREILELKIGGSLAPAETIEHTAEISQALGVCPILKFIDLQNGMYGRAEAAALPVLHTRTTEGSSSESENPENIFISGMRIYRGYTHTGELNDDMCQAYLLLKGASRRGMRSINSRQLGIVSLRLEKISSSVKISPDNRILASISVRASVTETQRTENGELTDGNFLAALEFDAEADIASIVSGFLSYTLHDLDADLLGLKNSLYNRDPAAYKNGTGQKLSDAVFDIDVNVDIAGGDLRGE